MDSNTIKELIEINIPACTAIVQGDDGRHFEAIVISEQFIPKTKVQQQQLVYAALGDAIRNGEIHALSLQTFTPETWAAKNTIS